MATEGGLAQAQDVAPVNSGANPYRVIRDWGQLTKEERPWGGSNGVAIDRDGKSVWATDRCSPGTAPGCLGTKANPSTISTKGKEIRASAVNVRGPHGIHVDRDGNVWVTERRGEPRRAQEVPGEDQRKRRRQFSPGKVLMTLGKPGEGIRRTPDRADRRRHRPSQRRHLVARVSQCIEDQSVARISVFDRNGKFLRVIGKTERTGEFRTPHMIKFRSRPPDRRRPPQPPHPDPDQGRKVCR
jgi:hypothetical protein